MLENSVSIETAKEVFDIEANSILALKDRLGEDFERAIDIMYSSKGHVIVTGMGKSGHIARKIAATLTSTGTPSYFLHPAESTHGDSGIITRNDCVIAISNSGETSELLNLLPLIKRFNVPLIAMTGVKDSTLAQKADVFLNVAVEKEACPLGKAPTASTTTALAMGDALAVCMLKKRGFTKEDFLLFHPSGSLGKGVLYNNAELMKQGEDLPVIGENTSFDEALKIISDKHLGVGIIVDENGFLTGILTDGDIRRTFLKGLNASQTTLKNVMTRNPKTVRSNALAATSLQIMEKYSITSLVVTDNNNKPIGLIHIHDLLKAGVA